jgi:sigma-B regulation protein RsbU (phosphoserine phosphatase)
LFDGSKYAANEGALSAGDVILFYTDGIQEVFDAGERQFGDEGLQAAILKRRGLPLDRLLEGIVSDAREFSANHGFLDDVCLVGMEFAEKG